MRYLPGTFQVLFRYLPQLTKFTKSHRHDKPGEPIKSTNTTDYDDTASGELILIFLQSTSGLLGTFQVPTWADGSKTYFFRVPQTWRTSRTNWINAYIANSTPKQRSKLRKKWHSTAQKIHLDKFPLSVFRLETSMVLSLCSGLPARRRGPEGPMTSSL